MAKVARRYETALKIAPEVAGTKNVRPGRCADCGRGMLRPVGGPGWRQLHCLSCGGQMIQTVGGAKTIRGYYVLSQREACALADGGKVEIVIEPERTIDSRTGVAFWTKCGHRAEYDINCRCYTCHSRV